MDLNWKVIQRHNFTKLGPLADFLELDETNRQHLLENPRFPLMLPKRLASKIKKNDLKDPILLQFVPLKEETLFSESFCSDPVQDKLFHKTSTLLHKYSQRVLLVTTQACAMHCRYCFRQNFPYNKNEDYQQDLEYIKNDPSILEVILSGGDPLSLSDTKLSQLILQLNNIDHVKIIRFHTRFLIGIPERITEDFLNILRQSSKQIIFVIHTNHPDELDEDVLESIKNIQALKIPVLCQTVLLKEVNDDVTILENLCWKLIQSGIIPYYLHQLDRVQGAMHFETKKEKGLQLIEELRKRLPGYAVFRYVAEIPQKASKTPILEMFTSFASNEAQG